MLDSTFLFLQFHLTEPKLREEISFRLHITPPPEDDSLRHVDTFAMFVKIGFIQLLHASIESSMRLIIEKCIDKEYNRRESSFARIYSRFFDETNLLGHKLIHDMITTLRDVNHDNGVYYANNNKEITINGSIYIFNNGKSAEFATWIFLLNLMPELKNMLVDIVELTKKY